MEQQFAKHAPQFKSSEDELAYLRAKVAEKEKELSSESVEADKETVTREVIKEYAKTDSAQALHKDRVMKPAESENIVLRLKPESHDGKMEELLGVLLEKGIKNALVILEKLNNPHLDDDFHRFLIQYIHAGKIPGLKESSPLFKALNMTLFEVTLPEPEKNESKGFKEFLGAMEQFYSGMQSIGDYANEENNYFTLEIALSNASDEVIVYAAVPNDRADMFEKQVLAFYHYAKISEVTNDYNIFNEGGSASGAYAKLAEEAVFPIKTYDTLDHDPIQTILNAFTKLKKEGEGASIQFTISPAGDKFIKKFTGVLEKVKKGEDVHDLMNTVYKVNKEIFEFTSDLIFGSGKKIDDTVGKKINDNAVSKITEKVKSTIVRTQVRVVASADTKARSDEIVDMLESAFNQFTEVNSNRIAFEKISDRGLPHFLHEYSYRLFDEDRAMPLNLKELTTLFHFPISLSSNPQLKQARAGVAPAPMEMGTDGILLGVNDYRGRQTEIRMGREDRVRHFYVVGQTGTGKTNILLNMIKQDIENGDGVCYIDPHGTDIQTILSTIPKERIDDVIYFDPAYTARPMGLNMLEYDPKYPEQKTFVVNEMMNIFNKLFDMKVGGGAMFEQYFRNSAFLIMEDPESGSTLLEITRVLADKSFRDAKLAKCKNPIIKQFWEGAEQTTGDQSLANFVPYISSKFDNFISNDIMRPVVLQQKSVFNFRQIMDDKKILLVNLSKGRLGDINANLIGLVIVNKIQMAALSRVDMYGKKMNDFYLYIDEFQNVTTDSIESILSEARKYRLSLNVAHQYISQLEENIKNAVFGNVGSMAVFRISPEDAKVLESKFEPTFTASDIIKLENYNAYVKMLVNGSPVKAFNMQTIAPTKGNVDLVDKIKELSYLKYGKDREEVEEEIMSRYGKSN